jgi:RNA polymerase sigma factor (sigma-70 family)
MARGRLRAVLGQLRRFVGAQGAGGLPDAQLLERFLTDRDEAAFDALLWRHGPMVLGVCRRVLRHDQDAEDAFQATFLAFVRKGRSIGKRASVAGWLYRVAYRTALAARSAAARRGAHEVQGVEVPAAAPVDEPVWGDLRAVLDAEVNRLPAKYRVPFVLCHLEGMTTEEAARHLGWPRGTVGTRVAWARERLRARLTRRGLTLSTGALALVLMQGARAAAVPAPLAGSAAKTALSFAANPAAGVIPARVAALTEGVLRAMWLTKWKRAVAVVLALAAVGTGVGVFMRPGLQGGQPAAQKEDPPKQGQTPFVYALLHVGDGESDMFRKNHVTLVKSRLVLNPALAKPEVARLEVVKRQADPVIWLENNLRVDFPNDGTILRIGLAGRPEKELAAVVDAVTSAYLKEVANAARDKKRFQLDELEKLCNAAEEKIRSQRQTLKRPGESLGLGRGGSSVQQQHLLQDLTDCTRELRRVKLAHAAARVRLKRACAQEVDTRKLDEEAAVLAEQENLLADEAKRLLEQADVRDRGSIELDARRLQLEQAEETIKRLRAEKERLQVELLQSVDRIRLLQSATTPPK